jgi:hypothetical protein
MCGPMPSTINSKNLALPLRARELHAGLLISSLQFPEKVQVQGLERLARLRGKSDHLNIALCVQSQKLPFIMRRTVIHGQKDI